MLNGADIRDRWTIFNPLLAHVNLQGVEYKIWSDSAVTRFESAVFYLHGLGGTLDDCPFIEDDVCPHAPLIRVSCYGLSEGLWNISKLSVATFGDICALLHNGRQAIYSIADALGLNSYSVVAHSWGGFIACIASLGDIRCERVMLLTSTPGICDALCRMNELFWMTIPWIQYEAEQAKQGNSLYQTAWEAISPYGHVENTTLKMLIFNREKDLIMRRWNIEHFVVYVRKNKMFEATAEFNTYPELSNWHDMPPEKFRNRMRSFLFSRSGQ
jgi:pimeloyl-ACP methyl ester carboxylesterase